jgi:hypothetical protein
VPGDKKANNKLSKPILDRIHRYAREGREPLARYGHDCVLLAHAYGQLPVVILRSHPKEFSEIRSAALVEWGRAARQRSAAH